MTVTINKIAATTVVNTKNFAQKVEATKVTVSTMTSTNKYKKFGTKNHRESDRNNGDTGDARNNSHYKEDRENHESCGHQKFGQKVHNS